MIHFFVTLTFLVQSVISSHGEFSFSAATKEKATNRARKSEKIFGAAAILKICVSFPAAL
jgi:hypothetical protein